MSSYGPLKPYLDLWGVYVVEIFEIAESFLNTMLSVGDFLFKSTIDVNSKIDAAIDKTISFFGDTELGERLFMMHMLGGGHNQEAHSPAFYVIGSGLVIILTIKFTKFVVDIIK